MDQSLIAELGHIAQDLQLKRKQVESVVQLLDDGNTVPFIARYRKEATGFLDEQQIQAVKRAVAQARQLVERKHTAIQSLESQQKLTDSLRTSFLSANNIRSLEDLYLPFKPKKQSLATMARQQGLGPLADAIFTRDAAVENLGELLPGMIDPDKGLNSHDDILTGVRQILAERIVEDAGVREAARHIFFNGKLTVSKQEHATPPVESGPTEQETQNVEVVNETPPERPVIEGSHEESPVVEATETSEQQPENAPTPPSTNARRGRSSSDPSHGFGPERDPSGEFRLYFEFSEPIRNIPPHRLLTINRGEKLGILSVKVDVDRNRLIDAILSRLPIDGHPHATLLKEAAVDSVDRLMMKAFEKEVRAELTEFAEDHAISLFARNLRSMLLQPPLRDQRLLVIDPGYRTGCKIAVLDESGGLLDQTVIFPHLKRKKKKKKKPALTAPVAPVEVKDFGAGVSGSEEQHRTEPSSAPNQRREASSPPTHLNPGSMPADSFYRVTDSDPAADSGTPPDGRLEDIPMELPPSANDQSSTESTAHDDKPAELARSEHEGQLGDAASSANVEPMIDAAESDSREFIDAPTPETSEQAGGSTADEDADEVSAAWAEIVKGKEQPPRARVEPSISKRDRGKLALVELCRKHQVRTIVIGNGTACRETEELVAEVIRESLPDIDYTVVNEAGASVYSTSPAAREEFPHYDATLRGTISIGRRLQDPLSELVKIDPTNISVGPFQHDVNPRRLKDALNDVVESCVNLVGVDVNKANASLLQHVSGLDAARARSIVEHRSANGPFRNREQLKQVAGLEPVAFTQAAGFLRITDGDQPLDSSPIHPDQYPLAQRILESLGVTASDLVDPEKREVAIAKFNEGPSLTELSARVQAHPDAVLDIINQLRQIGRDPRDEFPQPVFKRGVLQLEELTPGMRVSGTVLNVVDFGVFIDIGLKDSGLVHISELANRFVKSPHDVISVGETVTAWVIGVDMQRKRVSLTMIEPGTPRTRDQRGGQRRGRPEHGQGPQGENPTAGTRTVGDDAGQRRGDGRGRRPARHEQSASVPNRRSEQHPGEGQARGNRREGGGGPRRGGRGGPPGRGNDRGTEREELGAGRVAASRAPSPAPPIDEEQLKTKKHLNSFGELKALLDASKKKKGDDSKSS